MERIHGVGERLRLVTPQGTVDAAGVALGTGAHSGLLRRLRPFIEPVYDYVLVTAEQLAAIGWRNRQGVGDVANQFHYYRLTEDDRSCGAAKTRSTTRAVGSRRLAYGVGYTGLGVGATRFGARVMLDLFSGEETELTRLKMVRTKPLPFPPEPIRTGVIQLTRWSIARADRHEGRRNLWLRTLDWLGLGFDS